MQATAKPVTFEGLKKYAVAYARGIAYRRRMNHFFSDEEIEQCGCLAAWEVSQKYDPEKAGGAWRAYLQKRTFGVLMDMVRCRNDVPRYESANPTKLYWSKTRSLEAKVASDGERRIMLGEILPATERESYHARIDDFIKSDEWRRIPRRQRLILRLYCHELFTMKEIGQALGMSESRVSQLLTYLLPGNTLAIVENLPTPNYHAEAIAAAGTDGASLTPIGG